MAIFYASTLFCQTVGAISRPSWGDFTQPSVLLKVECCTIRRETKARSLKSVKAIGQTSHPFGRSRRWMVASHSLEMRLASLHLAGSHARVLDLQCWHGRHSLGRVDVKRRCRRLSSIVAVVRDTFPTWHDRIEIENVL